MGASGEAEGGAGDANAVAGEELNLDRGQWIFRWK